MDLKEQEKEEDRLADEVIKLTNPCKKCGKLPCVCKKGLPSINC